MLSRRFDPLAGIAAALFVAAFLPHPVSAEPDAVPLGFETVATPPPDSPSGIRPTAMFLIGARAYDGSGLQFTVRAKALVTAGRILENAGLAVDWIDCPARPVPEPHAGCSSAPAEGEVVIRLQRGTPPPDGRAALGYSLLQPDGTGMFATVFVDRVEWLAHQAGTAVDVLLGRAIAHELGHLLLGTGEHTASGLMRAIWTARELARDRPEDWRFSPRERQRVRESRLARAAGAVPAPAAGPTPVPQ